MSEPKNYQKMIPSQRLMLSKALQESLKMLQMNAFELKELLEKEIEENPLLEWDSTSFSSGVSSFLPRAMDIAAEESLFSSLLAQAREAFPIKKDLDLAKEILANLDPKGFLAIPAIELADALQVPLPTFLRILRMIQTFDPKGIGAQNLQESLLIQLREKGKESSLAYLIVEGDFGNLLKGKMSYIQKKYKLSKEKIQKEVLQELKSLSLEPAPSSSKESQAPIYSDLSIKKEQKKWIVEVNEDHIPRFSLKKEVLPLLHASTTPEKQMLRSFLAKGKWLMRSVNRRRKILLQIGLYIVQKQKDFLDGRAKLSPLSIKEIAFELSLNESTVARACREKYVETPFGVKAFQFFISHALKDEKGSTSAKAALEILQELLEKEDKKHPLSDQELSNMLKAQGIAMARRTVTKYREKLKLGSQKIRKFTINPTLNLQDQD